MHWYVVQVISGKERKVKKAIEEKVVANNMGEFIKNIVIPTEKVSEVKMGEQKIIEKRIWPGYILIHMSLTDDSWIFIKRIDGVIDFLGGENPSFLSEEEEKNLLSYMEEKKKGVVHKYKIEVGDTVKIVDGVFVNFIGNVLEVNQEKGRLSVMVSIFGRDTRVDDLEFWQVEEVTGEE